MTLKKHQEKLNKMWARRGKGKVGIRFMTSEEKYNQFMENIGDRYSAKVRSEALTKKWKIKNKKGV